MFRECRSTTARAQVRLPSTSDAILSPTDSEEALSHVYLAAVAAGAGYTIAQQNFDRDGVDFQIRAGGQMRPSLDLQIKATINLIEATPGLFRYPLKRRNYDLLREPTMVPRILVIMDLPRRPEHRLECRPSELVLRHCAYWASLADRPETPNVENVTVSVERRNRFDPAGLRALMEQARTGIVT